MYCCMVPLRCTGPCALCRVEVCLRTDVCVCVHGNGLTDQPSEIITMRCDKGLHTSAVAGEVQHTSSKNRYSIAGAQHRICQFVLDRCSSA